jgi:23S rRNA pseudouridine2605 synthase
MVVARGTRKTGSTNRKAGGTNRKAGSTSRKKSIPELSKGPLKSPGKFKKEAPGKLQKEATGKGHHEAAPKTHKRSERKVINPGRRVITKTQQENDSIRLNKYIASTGLCSRREADEFIVAGLVTINGKLVTELGVKVSPGDVVKYSGETLREEKKVYILLNKPKDYVTTVEDPHAKKTVLDLLKNACKERIYPVGRLDRNTTGVLLLTNDGEITKRLTHPRFEKLKIYHVYLNKNIKPGDMEKIATGITLEDGTIKADSVSYADPVDKTQVGIEIHSGRNHIVRRIFEHLGYEIVKLDRVYFAGLTKKNLHRGEWRFLTEKEIAMLKMNAFK